MTPPITKLRKVLERAGTGIGGLSGVEDGKSPMAEGKGEGGDNE